MAGDGYGGALFAAGAGLIRCFFTTDFTDFTDFLKDFELWERRFFC